MRRTVFAAVLALGMAGAPAAQSPVVTFTPTVGHPTFAKRDPVLRVTPGTRVETRTFSKPGDYYDPDKAGPWPGEVGPFFIEGAAPGDTLVVRILRLRPNRDTAISAVNPQGISALFADGRTRMLNDPPPPRRWVWRLDRARSVGMLDLPNSASKRIEIPLAPMLGRVAVAPAAKRPGAACGPAISAATWTSRTSAKARRCTCPSSTTAPTSTSETFTRPRAMARSWGRGSRRPRKYLRVRRRQGQGDSLAAHRRATTSWWPAACAR